MKLLGKRIILEEIEPYQVEKNQTIILTNETKSPLILAKILATGEDTKLKSGKKIIVNKMLCDNMVWNKKDCFIINCDDILAIEE